MFNPSRLRFARERRGLTKKKLASMINVHPRSITAHESGEFPPAEETVAGLATALSFPESFFYGDDIGKPNPESASFRAMTRMSASRRDAALCAGELACLLNSWIENHFNLPQTDLIDFSGEEPEAAAEMLRQHWNLGQLPIKSMVHLLEAKGVRVFSLSENTLDMNAFSFWRDESPFIFLNTMKSSENSRFDAAHELGHLVLHKNGLPGGQDAERQANEFATSFLMPKSDVLAHAPKNATVQSLIQLKHRWIVSVAALAFRLHKIGVITDWNYRMLYIEIAEKGYRKSEPNEAPRETSKLLAIIFDALKKEGLSKQHIANDLSIHVSEIEKLIFHLTLTAIAGSSAPSPRKKTSLRILK